MSGVMDGLLLAFDWTWRTSLDACVLIALIWTLQRLLSRWVSPRGLYCLWLLVPLRLALPSLPGDPLGLPRWDIAQAPHHVAQRIRATTAHEETSVPSRVMPPIPVAALPTTLAEFSPASPRPLHPMRADLAESSDPSEAGDQTPASSHLEDVVSDPATTKPSSRRKRSNLAPPVLEMAQASGETSTGALIDGAASRSTVVPLTPEPANASQSSPSWSAWMAWCWIAGALAVLGATVFREWRFRRALRISSRPVLDDAWLGQLQDVQRVFKTPRPITLLSTDLVDTPAAMGLWTPRILLPTSLVDSPPGPHTRHVLAHEVAHLRSADALVNLVLVLMRAWHWFNPLCFLASSRLLAAREVARDYDVLQRDPDSPPNAYARTLLDWADPMKPTTPRYAGCPFWADRRALTRRITMVAQYSRRSRTGSLLAGGLVLTCGWFTLTGAASTADDQTPNASDKTLGTVTEASPATLRDDRIHVQRPARPSWENQLREHLAATLLTFDLEDATIEEVAELFREEAGINVVVDMELVDQSQSSSVQIPPMSALSALDILCTQFEAAYSFRGGALFFEGEEGGNLVTHAYDVRRLMAQFQEDPDELADHLVGLVRSMSGSSYDWEHELCQARHWNGLLVVTQFDRVHDEIEEVLNSLLSGEHVDLDPDGTQRAANFQAKLHDTRLDVAFDETPYEDAAQFLTELTGVPVLISPRALEELYDRGTLLSLEVQQLTAHQLLEWMARLADNVEVSMTRDAATLVREESLREVAYYPVGHLLPDAVPDSVYLTEAFYEFIQDAIASDHWGDDAEVMFWGELMIVKQHPSYLARLEAFLDLLNRSMEARR